MALVLVTDVAVVVALVVVVADVEQGVILFWFCSTESKSFNF